MRHFGIRRKDASPKDMSAGWLCFTNGQVFATPSFSVATAQFWSLAHSGYDPVEHWEIKEFPPPPEIKDGSDYVTLNVSSMNPGDAAKLILETMPSIKGPSES